MKKKLVLLCMMNICCHNAPESDKDNNGDVNVNVKAKICKLNEMNFIVVLEAAWT